MTDKKFNEATKAWIKSHNISIESCDINIRHFKKQIVLLNKRIVAEEAEKKAKIELKLDVIKNLKKVNDKAKSKTKRTSK